MEIFQTIPKKIALLAGDPDLTEKRRRALQEQGFDVDVLEGLGDDESLLRGRYEVCVFPNLKGSRDLDGRVAAWAKQDGAPTFLGVIAPMSQNERRALLAAGLSEVMPANADLSEFVTRVRGLVLKRGPIRILIVEDDKEIARGLVRTFENAGYECALAVDLRETREQFAKAPVDALIIDRGLPDGDGLKFVERLRNQKASTPALILTDWNESAQRVYGLDAGANDYMGKPFNNDELLARVKVLLRPRRNEGRFIYGPLEVNKISKTVSYRNQSVEMSAKIFRTFLYLLERHWLAVPASMLRSDVWEMPNSESETSVITTGIKRLRDALEGVGLDKFVVNENKGYRFKLEGLLDVGHND